MFYGRTRKVFTKLQCAKTDGSYDKGLENLQKKNVLRIDDFCLHPIGEETKLNLLELLKDRYGCNSTIMTLQHPVAQGHDFIANSTIADAVLEWLIHNAFRIELNGDSMRKTQSRFL